MTSFDKFNLIRRLTCYGVGDVADEGSSVMRARDFWKTVTLDHADFLDRLLALFTEHRVPYCVVGGQAVNAYVEPVVSLDLDVAVALDRLDEVEALLGRTFGVERFPHRVNVSEPGSDLRVQIQTDLRYAAFVERAAPREVLGLRLPVARVEDVLQGKIWAAMDAGRRPSKRQKDLADIARLIEAFPHLRRDVPVDVLSKLI